MILAIPDCSHGRFPPWAALRAAQTLHPSQPFPPGCADTTGVQLQRAGLCLVRESTLWDLATFITLLHPSKHSRDRAVWHVPKGSLLWQVPVALGHFLGCEQTGLGCAVKPSDAGGRWTVPGTNVHPEKPGTTGHGGTRGSLSITDPALTPSGRISPTQGEGASPASNSKFHTAVSPLTWHPTWLCLFFP